MLIRELAARGWKQRLVARHGHELFKRCADVPGVECRPVGSNPIAAGLAIRGCSLAHSHEARTVYSALLASLLFGVPYLVTRRVANPQNISAIRGLAYRRARYMVSISRAVEEKVRSRHPAIEQVVIPDAKAGFDSDPVTVAAIRARYPGKTLIGNVGTYDHAAKGQSTIIEAARIAADKHPDWQFLLCGAGKDEARFGKEIDELANIELVGWIDNVGDYLAAFDLFLFPSLREALGSSLLDAMQFGLPIVATKIGGIPSVVEDRVNGYLIAPENPQEMLAALAELLGDRDELQAMSERNKVHADNFSASKMADAYEKLYRAAQST